MRHAAALAFMLAGCFCFAGPYNLAGDWVVDRSNIPKTAQPTGIYLRFRKDGSVAAYGVHLVESGTYKIAGDKLTITFLKVNGKLVKDVRKSIGIFRIADKGKALLGDSGVNMHGKELTMRLVRKK